MPFWQGSITRLPFMYYIIHLVDFFKFTEWWIISLFICAYQVCRMLTNMIAAAGYYQSIHIIGGLLSFGGFLTVYFAPHDLLIPFCVGTTVIGFADVFSSMQIYVKEEYGSDVKQLGINMKVQ